MVINNLVGFSGRNVKSPMKQRSEQPQNVQAKIGARQAPSKLNTNPSLPNIKTGESTSVHHRKGNQKEPETRKDYRGTTVGFLLDDQEEQLNKKTIPVRSNINLRRNSMFRTEDYAKVKAQQEKKEEADNRRRRGITASIAPSRSQSAFYQSIAEKPEDTLTHTTTTETHTSQGESGMNRTPSFLPQKPDDEPPETFKRNFSEGRARKNYDLFVPAMRDPNDPHFDPRPKLSSIPQNEQLHPHPSDLTTHKLSDVKHSLYNPDIKTFRAMADDDKFGSVCGSSLRHTTRATREDFALAEAGVYRPPHKFAAPRPPPPACPSVTHRSVSQAQVLQAQEVWRTFLASPHCEVGRPAAETAMYTNIWRNLHDFRFENQILQLGRKPPVAARFILKPEPGLHNFRQRPLPQNTLNRYR